MAKTAKLKKSTKPPSLHSRAAKRASSPGLSVPKSSSQRPSIILSTHQNGGGIAKRKSKAKMSRQQRLRQEKGVERGEAVRDVRAKKMERSLGREKVGRERGAAWDELNAKIQGRRKRGRGESNAAEKGEEDWESDQSMGEEDDEGDGIDKIGEGGGPVAMIESDTENNTPGVEKVELLQEKLIDPLEEEIL